MVEAGWGLWEGVGRGLVEEEESAWGWGGR